TQRTMQTLDLLEIDVAIDDFGTGYSSMAYLKLPAVTYLKIDRSFVTGLPGDANDAAITEAMLAMSRSLGLIAIAEGIETEAQHDFLLRAGCTEGQGYLYSYGLSRPGSSARRSNGQRVRVSNARYSPNSDCSASTTTARFSWRMPCRPGLYRPGSIELIMPGSSATRAPPATGGRMLCGPSCTLRKYPTPWPVPWP